MKKIDFKKEYKSFYYPSSKKFEIINIPTMKFLMIDGEGNPNTAKSYKDAVETLFSVSYKLKFLIKKSELEIDYKVMPLEGLWYAKPDQGLNIDDKESWNWTAMIMQPEFIKSDMIELAVNEVKKKKSLESLSVLRFEEFQEELCAQILYIGPYSEEAPTIEKMHSYITENRYTFNGKHHEVYLNDPQRTSPEKLKTILRQPIIKQG